MTQFCTRNIPCQPGQFFLTLCPNGPHKRLCVVLKHTRVVRHLLHAFTPHGPGPGESQTIRCFVIPLRMGWNTRTNTDTAHSAWKPHLIGRKCKSHGGQQRMLKRYPQDVRFLRHVQEEQRFEHTPQFFFGRKPILGAYDR